MENERLENKSDIKPCNYYAMSREQRKNEINRDIGTSGTLTYERTGCYKCDGQNKDCEFYQQLLKNNLQETKWKT